MTRPLRTPQNQIRTQLRDAFLQWLYKPMLEQLQQQIVAIIKENAAIQWLPHYSFMYKGQLWAIQTQAPRKSQKLHDSLIGRMEAYLQERRELEQEQSQCLAGILRILNAIKDPRDCLRILPETLHQPLVPLLAEYPDAPSLLPEDSILQLREDNAPYINIMKQRLVLNLLI